MRKRIIVLYICLGLVVAVLLSLFMYRYSTNLYRQEVETLLLDNATLIGDALARESFPLEPGGLDARAVRYAKLLALDDAGGRVQSRPRITFIREDGIVIGDSETDSVSMENHSDRSEVMDALRLGTGSSERSSATLGVLYAYHARYFAESRLVIRLALPLHELQAIRTGIIQSAALGVLGGIFVTGLLAFLFSRFVTSPVTNLSRQLSSLGGTQYRERLKSTDDAELGSLTKNVNLMAERLEQSIAALDDRNVKVDTIIKSLPNGLVAVDREMRLIMVNPVVFGMFGMKEQSEVIGHPVVEVFRNRSLLDLLEAVMKADRSEKREIVTYEGGKRILEVNACPILPIHDGPGNSGALAHVADVTGIRKLEESRSEFVSNVTHELKTPLTSIRGFVETLRSGAMQDEAVAEKFLVIIDIEADRLSRLIDDILSLSEIEGMKQEAALSEFLLAPLVEDVAEMLSAPAHDRNITVTLMIPEGFLMKANRNRIKQLLINLMDNAVKYNRDGGSVTVRADRLRGGRTAIRVTDTGIGIPDEFRERIFERFYRVDKGRTRSQGGTGLGLSIVKHIALLYGGNVTVDSEPGKGSTFIVEI
jgi:two-component system phosphate regulon sensor histidine kinase PhoR